MPMEREDTSRDSAQYAEMVAEVFVETMRKSVSRHDSCVNDTDITQALTECLQYVYLHGPSPIRQIAAGLEMSVSGASQLVERLVKKALVTRRDDEQDRRLTSVELTAEGEEHVRSTREKRSQWFDAILQAMPHSQRRAFREGLESFLRVALASEDNVDRACVRCGIEHTTSCIVSKVKSKRIAAHQRIGVER